MCVKLFKVLTWQGSTLKDKELGMVLFIIVSIFRSIQEIITNIKKNWSNNTDDKNYITLFENIISKM